VKRDLGPGVVAVVCALPLVLWAAGAPLADRFGPASLTLRSLAVAVALPAYAAFGTNVVLAARLRTVELLFGGLDHIYRVHRRLGATVAIALVAHAGLMAASRGTAGIDAAVGLFQPSAGSAIFSGVVVLAVVVTAVLLSFYAPLRHGLFVNVQRLMGLAFVASAFHVFRVPAASAASRPLQAYLAALAVAAGSAYLYRSLLGQFLVRRYPYQLVDVHRLDERVVELVAAPEGQPLRFVPGQFAFVSLDHPFADRGPHPFSITSARGERNLRFVVKGVGDHTTALLDAKPGVRARVEGPYGALSHERMATTRQIWIAGGIGITPFLSMARSLDQERYRVDLYYGTAHASEAHFMDELAAIASAGGGSFRVIPVREDEEGFITAEKVAEACGDLADCDILICGPPAMLDNLMGQFLARGVPESRIHAEDFRFH
jgi:predicted ferric reductase